MMLAITLLCLGTIASLQSEFPPSNIAYPDILFGSKTPYFVAQGDDLNKLQDHEIIQIFGIFRHGTRNPSEDDNNDMKVLNNIKKNIGSKAKISSNDRQAIKNWVNLAEKNKNLIDQGKIDMEHLATRLRNNFPSIFTNKFNSAIHKVLSSNEERAKDSAVYFLQNAFPDTKIKKKNVPAWEDNDVTLNIDKLREKLRQNKNKNNPDSEVNKFLNGDKMKKTIINVTELLNYNSTFNYKDVKAMYEACRHDYTRNIEMSMNSKPAWCRVFTKDDLLNLEYLDDLIWNEKFGYNSHYGDKLGCPLIMRIKMSFEAAISNPTVKAVLNFGHRSNLFPTFTMLGLAYDETRLSADNMDNMSNRRWRTSFLNPFSANTILILSKFNNKFYVSVFVNENIVDLTIENNKTCEICEWSQFEKKLNNFILKHNSNNHENNGCNFGFNITLP
ncbi:multiple inositol polyphosphate phosphatase 1-like [Daktulosphaira vitifoliae]|uniref:multiple inositol polyphosphate phosphatase 1-like n=1 Tax=Daktulosphaira vitifoliae TaxID=58002 RepID=UPI0021A9EF5B|nr:multiple inositol polyphosphate phosphatase 1-like [Daktulosphaira vitifoliae]XP_050520565.1 multiple inositol polyphosphate phosphatase 1-like [Daktulosphaira vitifoliae]XP_050520566.1 multiple inositol polyphosphate phosphatase 1-like [Daktulosphaira vitifoliae]